MNVVCLCGEIISTRSQPQWEETNVALVALPGFIVALKAKCFVASPHFCIVALLLHIDSDCC